MQTSKTKRRLIVLTVIAASLILAVGLGLLAPTFAYIGASQEFKRSINESGIFNNDLDTLVPIAALHNVIRDHMLGENQKTPMLLFIGYDGIRADLMPNAFKRGNASAVYRVASGVAQEGSGSLMLTRVGGANRGDEHPSTGPGWTSAFTGVWNDVHRVNSNTAPKCHTVSTIMYILHNANVSTSLSFTWPNFKTRLWNDEFISAPSMFNHGVTDEGTFNYMLTAINNGTRAIFGILDDTDGAGHAWGFHPGSRRYVDAFEYAEAQANKLIDAVLARDNFVNEDWLVIIATDHGGFGLLHDSERIMITTVFFAMNKMFSLCG